MRNTALSSDARSDAGFSLGEAMVAVALTLIVLSAAVETMARSMSLAATSRVISATNHGLQAAMSFMVRDIMQTGQGIPLGGIPLPSGGGAAAVFRPGPTPTDAETPLTFAAGQTTLTAVSPGNGLGPRLLGVDTDIITVLYADRTLDLASVPLAAIAADGSTMTVDDSVPITGVGGIREGDLILFTNSFGSALQMVTETPEGQTVTFGDDDPMRLNQRSAAAGSIMNLRDEDGAFPPTTATRIVMVSYYVDTETDPNLPRLVRRVNMGDRLAIAMGVENLQITYDVVDGVTNPTNVDTPAGANGPNQIRKANLFLLARSQDVDQQRGDFFRNSMATQVGLRSLSFVDRYQ
jgi:Tfp pilus assembly protein PilW